jgi:hypothetical protein
VAWFVLSLTLALLLAMAIAFSFLIKVVRGNIRQLERERNVHNLQVSQLLDRIANAEGKPWTLPPRPVVEVKEEEEPPDLEWREV